MPSRAATASLLTNRRFACTVIRLAKQAGSAQEANGASEDEEHYLREDGVSERLQAAL